MNQQKKELTSYFDNMSLFVIGLLLIVFPVLFLSTTTDAFVFPKQIALAATTTIFILFFGLRTIIDAKLKLRSAPFNLAIGLFLVVTFVSALLSVNRTDAFIAFVPVLFAGFLYYGIVNLVRSERQLLFVLASLITGAVLSSFIAIFSFFKVYPLPFDYTHAQYFTTFGSLLDQAIYLALVLPISGYFVYSFVTSMSSNKQKHSQLFSANMGEHGHKKSSNLNYLFTAGFVFIAFALGVTLYQLLTTQKPLILPFETGLQTGLSALSQDTGRFFQSLFFGSGYGTYLVDFTRFKQASYNASDALWSFTFFRSSSLVLELLATTGLAGIAAFFFLILRVIREGNFFLPLVLALVATFLLPFSFTLLTLLFVLFAIFAVIRIQNNPDKYSEIEFYFVALKKGFLQAVPEGEHVTQNPVQKRYSKLLPILFFVFLLVIIGVPTYFTVRLIASDFVFQRSVVAASKNNGLETYNLEISAIKIFPYRDVYYRAFSQTNLALASALARSQQSNSSPSAQVQQNIVTLIQQSITAARSGVSYAPLTAINWNNLSSIYRSLIGFGQNADQFTVLSSQQAIALDGNNPQQYLDLGGIYYQLGMYDDAIRQFQISINLKTNYANAYYNLGHALEAKGDLAGALSQYQAVKNLVVDNKDNTKKISDEIAALQEKIKSSSDNATTPTASASAELTPSETEAQKPLNTATNPATQLPERNPKLKIPGPTLSPATKKDTTTSEEATPTPAQ